MHFLIYRQDQCAIFITAQSPLPKQWEVGTLKGSSKGVEHGMPLFAHGAQITSNGTEVSGTRIATKGPGNLLLHLDHTHIELHLLVGKGYHQPRSADPPGPSADRGVFLFLAILCMLLSALRMHLGDFSRLLLLCSYFISFSHSGKEALSSYVLKGYSMHVLLSSLMIFGKVSH